MTTIPTVVPPLPRSNDWKRHHVRADAFRWLAAGWRDFCAEPGASLFYGILVFGISAGIIVGLFVSHLDSVLFPALAGFVIVGPILAIGLYEKSRRLSEGEPVSLVKMIFVRPASGGQVLFTGLILCLLMLLWMRAAVLIYALFFGLRPFPGLSQVAGVLFTTRTGWAMLFVGTAVGGLFAAFSFAISVLAIPMLLEERVGALAAMAASMALVWNNLPGHADLGSDRACAYPARLGDRPHWIDRCVSPSRSRDLACLVRVPVVSQPEAGRRGVRDGLSVPDPDLGDVRRDWARRLYVVAAERAIRGSGRRSTSHPRK